MHRELALAIHFLLLGIALFTASYLLFEPAGWLLALAGRASMGVAFGLYADAKIMPESPPSMIAISILAGVFAFSWGG